MLINEDLTYFYQDNENTLIGKRPETKTESDLARVIAAGKPQAVIDKFAELVTVGKHWDWFEDYALYLNAMDTWDKWVAPEVEDGEEVPVKPEQPADHYPRYTGNPLDQYANEIAKKAGIIVQGVGVSLNESNQNGIASVSAGEELAVKFGSSIFPLNFNAETAQGVAAVQFETLEDFEQFALEFMVARQAFFK